MGPGGTQHRCKQLASCAEAIPRRSSSWNFCAAEVGSWRLPRIPRYIYILEICRTYNMNNYNNYIYIYVNRDIERYVVVVYLHLLHLHAQFTGCLNVPTRFTHIFPMFTFPMFTLPEMSLYSLIVSHS